MAMRSVKVNLVLDAVEVRMRVCTEPNCPNLVPKAGRCPACSRAYERKRGTASQRGYDSTHQRLRQSWQQLMDAGKQLTCWRCGKPIDPTAWHLGHDDHDRTRYRGPECVPCNTSTSTRRASRPPGEGPSPAAA